MDVIKTASPFCVPLTVGL